MCVAECNWKTKNKIISFKKAIIIYPYRKVECDGLFHINKSNIFEKLSFSTYTYPLETIRNSEIVKIIKLIKKIIKIVSSKNVS